MALITCPECQREVSDQAKECPNCGYPVQNIRNEDPYEYISDEIEVNENEQKLRSYGLWSFILAIFSLFLPVPIINIVIAIFAVALAAKGLKASKRGFAIAGLVIGIIALVGAISLLVTDGYTDMF